MPSRGRGRGGLLRLVCRRGGLRGLAGERLGLGLRGRDGIPVRHQQRGMRERDRLDIVRRDDHAHPDLGLVEQFFRKAVGHPHAAVRGGIAGQRPAMQRDAVPGQALHVRHPGIVIEARMVVLVLFEQGEDAGRSFPSRDAGRYRRTQDPAVGVVERDLLALDRHDRHDRLAGLARRHSLGGCGGALLFRRGAGGQRRQCSHRRQRRDDGRPPTTHCPTVPRRRQSNCHAMPRLKCLPAPASITYQIAISE